VDGPLIVEQSDATVVVPPDARAEALPGGILKVTATEAAAPAEASIVELEVNAG
jgi:hypothetical protein